jgi:hypothetical protein
MRAGYHEMPQMCDSNDSWADSPDVDRIRPNVEAGIPGASTIRGAGRSWLLARLLLKR